MTKAPLVTTIVCGLALTLVHAQQRRDNAAQPATGTATISGQVVSDEQVPVPIRRAIVTVSGQDMPASRSAITDDDGKFAIDRLKEGRVSISAIKTAYLPASYGARRPGRPGTVVVLAAGQRLDVVLRMARGAVVTGAVHDRQGTPLSGLQIRAIDTRDGAQSSRTPDQNLVTTDDRGIYRIFGLPPSEYIISASVSRLPGSGEIGRRSDGETDALLAQLARRGSSGVMPSAGAPVPAPGIPTTPASAPAPSPRPAAIAFAPVYFPGTSLYPSAVKVKVAAGEERGGVDIVMDPVPVSTIDGVVISGTGQALAKIQMSITPEAPRTSWRGGPSPVLSTQPGPDGRFEYTNVPPGRYTIAARSSPGDTSQSDSSRPGVGRAGGGAPQPLRAAPGENLYALETVDINALPVGGLTLSLMRGSHLSGRVVFAGSTLKPPSDLTTFQMQITPPNGTSMSSTNGTIMGNTFSSVFPVYVKSDATFELVNIAPGPYKMSVKVPPALDAGWWLRSAMLAGHDLLDAPFDVSAAVDLKDVVVTFSDQHTELAGTLQNAGGLPAPEYFVIAFPSDRSLWQPGSRRIVSTRPATDGAFTLRDVPPGDYRLAALTDVDPSDLNDSSFFEQLLPASVTVTIGEGEKKRQDIRIK